MIHRKAWLLLCGLVLVASLHATARADDKSEARTYFELGVEASRAQKWEEARAQFMHSLQLLPKASTMFNLAVADIKLGLGREALEQLDAFKGAASPTEHAQMLERAQVLRPQAQALVDSQQATAEHGGNVLSKTDDGFTDEVRRLVAKARDDYAQGRDREALSGFEQAYKASKRAELLYNIGVVADRLREDRRAARAYDQFVAALPDAPEAAVAQVRSDALHAVLAERERAGEEAVRAQQQPPHQQEPITGGTSLVRPRAFLVVGPLLIAGAVVGMVALANKRSDYQKCLDSDRCINKDDVRGDRPLVLTGIGAMGVLAGTGLVFTIAGAVQLSHRKSMIDRAFKRVTPAFTADRNGGLFTLQGRF